MRTPEPPVGIPWHEASFVPAFGRFWRGYVVFRGRAARPEFWWWALWWAIFSVVVNVFYGVGAFSAALAPPSSAEQERLTEAMDSANPFPVWGYLLSSLPPAAMIALAVFTIVGLAALLPWIAMAVRRLHDTNRSGWWTLLSLVPVGNIVVLVFLVLPSDERRTRFDDSTHEQTHR
ncbi:DUF805 domain-containing protein [Curtobacterium sp. RRHDQ10]|uniref:DUF805 domain-containing protein n=1 Tax=Curtobacterium phyllosphaerae TaxID=3413379 RepID=UPI003BEF76F8